MRKCLCTVIILSVAILIVGACGGGGGGRDGNLNSLFDGDYLINVMAEESGIETWRFPVTADGDGNASAFTNTTVDLSYNVALDRTISVGPGPAVVNTFETSYGIISADGAFMTMTDTVDEGDIEFNVAVAKSSMATTTVLVGQYIVSQAGTNAIGFYTSRVLTTINAGGVTGSWEILNHSQGAAVGATGTLTITVSTNDGTFVVNNGGPDDHYGIVSPDGNMFAIMDTPTGSANENVIAVAVRKSTAGTPDGIGDYVLNQIGLNAPATTPEIFTSRIDLTTGIGTFDFQMTANSLGPPLSSGSGIPYSVSADGTVTFTGNAGWNGIVSPDGQVMVLVDTDTSTAGEIHLGVAIKK
jgi:hypothetical protein